MPWGLGPGVPQSVPAWRLLPQVPLWLREPRSPGATACLCHLPVTCTSFLSPPVSLFSSQSLLLCLCASLHLSLAAPVALCPSPSRTPGLGRTGDILALSVSAKARLGCVRTALTFVTQRVLCVSSAGVSQVN